MARIARILGTAAVAALGGAATYYWRESRTPQPAYRLLRAEGAFSLRDYPALAVASVSAVGERERALNSGFRRLAGYIFAADRPGEPLAMTAPVLQDRDGSAGWRTRFVMPEGRTPADLPAPHGGVELDTLAPRTVAAVRFSGGAGDAALRRREDALRRWCEGQQLQPVGGFEYAFYNSPMIPPFLRRNEVLVPVHPT